MLPLPLNPKEWVRWLVRRVLKDDQTVDWFLGEIMRFQKRSGKHFYIHGEIDYLQGTEEGDAITFKVVKWERR